jgi:hypothetical protein
MTSSHEGSRVAGGNTDVRRVNDLASCRDDALRVMVMVNTRFSFTSALADTVNETTLSSNTTTPDWALARLIR